MASMTKSKL
jgi:hypothetical protein